VMRSAQEWARHPQGAAVAREPLVHWTYSRVRPVADAAGGDPRRPLAGLRVLDLTRVIAGPVATRYLAGLGAEVLRVDPPGWDEPALVPDMTLGKRTARVDATTTVGRDALEQLIAGADVLVHGYRPGALPLDRLIEANPALVVASLSAWGTAGPWAGRRGFDSIVQAASGIAMVESPDGVRPGALPAQALDHSAGYLLAAAVATALQRGGGWSVSTSLARIAHELLTADRSVQPEPGRFTPTTVTHGPLTYARPALHADDFPAPPRPWGKDEPAFLR
jgi:crotonobetainyl-CoA:carnitine CoA-transferase CaiB-like acyl-CoA transferase